MTAPDFNDCEGHTQRGPRLEKMQFIKRAAVVDSTAIIMNSFQVKTFHQNYASKYGSGNGGERQADSSNEELCSTTISNSMNFPKHC